ncbi:uncharacterized protein LOC128956573 [Oppia nitens]|uniref:uncharacterized protein LOC128956573 n=1 Tax=Oppia nitens TaxID=1686743 RepID=UPI0023DB220E|nr:uncharacterized protein LOC128956573 [Oppia nitens]
MVFKKKTNEEVVNNSDEEVFLLVIPSGSHFFFLKYLFLCSVITLIIGSGVLFGLSIDRLANISDNIDSIERFGINELAAKRTEKLQQQKSSSILSLIINSLIILSSLFGIVSILRDNFLQILIYCVVNTTVLFVGLILLGGEQTKAALVLLQIAVTGFAITYTLSIYCQMRAELKRKKKKKKSMKKSRNNLDNNKKLPKTVSEKNNDINGQSLANANGLVVGMNGNDQTYQRYDDIINSGFNDSLSISDNNPDFNDSFDSDLKEIKGIIV